MATRQAGQEAEQQALEHLLQQGLQLLERNWHCRTGELDLVMLDGDTVVFVEVRYRQHARWGGALESIDARKRDKLIGSAEHYLMKTPCWASHPCRFDVVILEGHSRLQWLRNAFDC